MLPLFFATLVAVAPPPSPSPANQRQVAFASADGSLMSGTLSWAPDSEGAAPAFVLVAGSEPDASFAAIAAGLNDAGFTVLRYNERENAPSDVLAAVASMKKDPHVDADRLYLLGRGEGAALAMGAAVAGAPVRGLVLLAPLPIPNGVDPSVEVANVGVPMLVLRGSNAFVASAHAAHRNVQYGELDGDDPRVFAAIEGWMAETQ